MSISERRSKNRFLCADLVTVRWFETHGPQSGQSAEAILEDISALGACIQVEEPIPLDVSITLSIGDVSFPGAVCYTVYRDYGYFVGIRFLENTFWSHEMVMPRHLTNLQALAPPDDPALPGEA